MNGVEFNVFGVPAPQGSKKAFVVAGKARMTDMGGGKGAQWRDAVAVAAHQHVTDPLDGPLRLVVRFRFPMPSSRSKTVRNAGVGWKTTAPDTDKLVRSIGDALTTSGLITDDARFAVVLASKVETTSWTGAEIAITPITHEVHAHD